MKVQYTGFNLFGLVTETESVIKSFTEFTYDSLKNLHLTHTFAIVENDNNVFFHGYYNEKTHQTIEIKTDPKKIIKRVSAYDNRAFVLYETGDVYQINMNENLRLDQHVIDIDDPLIDSIVDIAVGTEILIVITKEGRIYNVPNKLDFRNKDIVQVVTGREHCVLLDGSGNVYTFGGGSKGQLGHGDLINKEIPVQVEALAGIKIRKVAAGGWHSCALSETGDLYMWGWNQDGQLGLYDAEANDKRSVVATPEPVNFSDCEANVTDVACGTRHTVALLGNKIYGVGLNKYCQLGCHLSDDKTPMKCLHVNNTKVLALICGPWSTAILTLDDDDTSSTAGLQAKLSTSTVHVS